MTINYNVTGKERKALAQALAEITFSELAYAGAPTFAYQIAYYTVDKNGVVSYPDSIAPETVAMTVERLKERGFMPEETETEDNTLTGSEIADEEMSSEVDMIEEDAPADIAAETPDVAPEPESDAIPEEEDTEATEGEISPDAAVSEAEGSEVSAETDDVHLTITIPRKTLPDDALIRLQAIVLNKKVLFQRAVQADALPIEITDKDISFPWFTLTGIDGEAAAYTQFITALCQMAKEQTRILDKPYDGDNDRFAMRIFMVRMGMKGAQFALARKLMMKHLTGNSGWRYGAPPKKEPEAECDTEPETEPEAKPETETEPETEADPVKADNTLHGESDVESAEAEHEES